MRRAIQPPSACSEGTTMHISQRELPVSAAHHQITRSERAGLRHRIRTTAATLILVAGVGTLSGIFPSTVATAATTAVDQCNGDETGAAREIRCDVTVTNTLDIATGATSSTVTTTACAGAPGEAVCVTTPGALTTDIVGSIDQCNGSANAGGSIVTCNVIVVNNITGAGSTTPATVNQCIGSGQGGGAEPTTICAPQTSVTGADVTQCNGSGNNGGATGRVTCTVPTSTVSALWSVTINQCNGSANGGGDLVTCTAQITTNVLAPEAAPTSTDTGAATTIPGTIPGTSPAGTSGAMPPVGGATPPAGAVPDAGPNASTTVAGELPVTGTTTIGLLIAFALTAAGVGVLLSSRRVSPVREDRD